MPEAWSPDGRASTLDEESQAALKVNRELDQFMAAISAQESGGNYGATNSRSGAHGKFQIMPANWPAWSREALGPGTHAQTPENQEKVARYKMLQYYRQFHSWDAVAVAWFAGPGRAERFVNGDTSVLSISDGNMTVGQYIDKARRGMGAQAGAIGSVIGGDMGGTAGGGASDEGLPDNASPAEVEAFIRNKFPSMAGFLDVPEVRELLIKAAQEDYDLAELEGALHQLPWWKANGVDSRLYIARLREDPAEAEAMVQKRMADLGPRFSQLGSDVSLRAIAEASLKFGWSEQQLLDNFAGHLQYDKEHGGLKQGSVADVSADDLTAIARNEYLVPVVRRDVEQWAIDIYSGKRTEEQFRNFLADQAEARFPGLKERGITPGEYLAPIRNVIADTLEMSPEAIDLLSPRWSQVLQVDSDGKTAPRAMTIYEAQKFARSQKEYEYTGRARDEVASFVDNLGRRMGLTA